MSLMMIFMFVIEVRATVASHVDSLRQAYNSEHAILLKDFDASEQSFRAALMYAESTLSGGPKRTILEVTDHRKNNYSMLGDGANSKLSLGIEDFFNSENYLVRFSEVASELGGAISGREVSSGEIMLSYLYGLHHDAFLIISPFNKQTQGRVAAEHEYFIRALKREMEKRTSDRLWKDIASGQKPMYWLSPSVNSYTGLNVIKAAGPIMVGDKPFAMLIMEFPLPKLTGTSLAGKASGTYTLFSEDGEIVCSTESTVAHVKASNDFGCGDSAQQLGREHEERYGWEFLTISEKVGDTGLLLEFRYSWRDLIVTMGRTIALEVVTALAIIAFIWGGLLYFKLCIFRPLIKRSLQVFESEQLNRTLIETAPVGLGLLDIKTGEPLLQSSAMNQLQSRICLNGRKLSEVLLQHFEVSEKASFKLDVSFDTHDGSEVSLAVSMAPVRYRARDALVVAFVDVTDKKRLENNLLKAKEIADKANAAKSSFLAAMSHEIRTPLHAILGNLELLSMTASDSQRDRLKTIRRASDNLIGIVSDVLDFSKIEAGELSLENIELDVLEVASAALAIFTPIAEAKGLHLRGEFGVAATLPMRGDPTRLGQVLNNLLSNAIKFTEKGQVILRISMVSVDLLCFEIEDTGIGMSEVQVQQVFRAFSQTDSTINRRYGGTGLGLTLCQRLVEAMGGQLAVHSVLNSGSTFRFVIPKGDPVRIADHPRFAGEPILVLTETPSCQIYLEGVFGAWDLRATFFQHPAQVDDGIFLTDPVLVIWGPRLTWQPDDENRLIEAASWVIDCRSDGPVDPIAFGRIISTSTCGPQGLAQALRFALNGEQLKTQGESHPALPVELRVLVVEDNPVNRQLFEEQLRFLGCRVRTVEDGVQALEHLTQESFDVLLTDLSMPVLDGYALAQHIQDCWPLLPVVAATANVTPQEQERCRAVGIVKVVTKPLSLGGLQKVLSEVCGLVGQDSMTLKDGDLLMGHDLPAKILSTFRQFCKDAFTRIRQALDENNREVLLNELHALKGALGVYRYTEACQRLSAVEIRLKAGECRAVASLATVLRALEDELGIV